MIIVVLILALIALWAIVLGPPLLEKRRGSPANSIVAFNQRLSVLASTQRNSVEGEAPQIPAPGMPAQPMTVSPARRDSYPTVGSTVTLVTQDGRPVGQFEPKRNALPTPPPSPRPVLSPQQTRPVPAISAHELGQVRRRRQVFQVLLGLAGGTFILGLLPGARSILLLSFVFIGLLGGYIYLLLKWKQNRIEQSRKVRHLRATEVQAPAGEILEPADEGLRLVAGDQPK